MAAFRGKPREALAAVRNVRNAGWLAFLDTVRTVRFDGILALRGRLPAFEKTA